MTPAPPRIPLIRRKVAPRRWTTGESPRFDSRESWSQFDHIRNMGEPPYFGRWVSSAGWPGVRSDGRRVQGSTGAEVPTPPPPPTVQSAAVGE
jgi:hypothetical protein